MKIKAEIVNKGIFDGYIFAVAQGSATFEVKRNIRKSIISNGGVVSYLVTKRCNYLILLDGNTSSTSVGYTIKTAHKYKIPVVSADFVDKCIEEDGISSVTSFAISLKSSAKKTINDAFNYGKVSIAAKDEEVVKKSSVTGKYLKVWEYLDAAMPPFYEFPYVLAKYTVLKSKTRTNIACTYYASVEIHVKANSTNNDSGHKYCVFVYSGTDQSDFVRVKGKLIPNQNKSSKTCRLTNDSEVALESYTKILKSLKSPPRSMTICKLIDESIPTFVGSTELQKVIENLNISNDNIDVQVKDMVGHMWKETFGCIGITSTFDATAYTINNLDEAEKCLIEIWKQDDKKCDEFQDLVNKYTNLIPNQKQVDFTVIQNIYKQRKFLKLLRDVVVLSEVNPDGILGAYKALNCRLNFVNKDSLEYASIANTIVEIGPKIDLINVFAVRRPIEDENFMFSLTNKKILFHGSSIENYIGILSRGLLPASDLPELADPEIKVGELGNGIYFTDSIKKCLNYSTVNDSRQSRLMLLAEVALGTCYETFTKMPNLTCPPEGYDSVNGLIGSQFKEKEFVVYNVNQQRLIYLIEFKMPEDTLSTAFVKAEANFENFWMPKEIAPDVTPTVSLEQILSLKEQNLGSVKWGLLDNLGRSIPLKEVHVRGRILDLAANIVIFQTYYNNFSTTMKEFKFVFPLNDETAVCGFEAFIGEKHVIGEIQEQKKAHAMYKEAVSKGHGGYLMDEQKTETFSITIGNLPPKTSVTIKITYVTELFTEGEHMAFRLPKGITGGRDVNEQSLKMAIEMPFVIKRISSHINNIQIKKTDTKATVQLVNGESLDNGFELVIQLAEIHVPRMWVENHPDSDSQACMLTFYPSFDVEEDLTEKSVIIMLDASNSMTGEVFEVAKTIALLCLHKLPSGWNFNVIIFGTVWEELFSSCQPNNLENVTEAKEFIEKATSRMGCTDVYQAIRSLFLMAPSGKYFQNVFLITDGHILCAENLINAAATNLLNTRIFTFGVGSQKVSCDKHFLKKLAYKSSGAYEEFDLQTKSKWIPNVSSQFQKTSQAVITDVRVEWQQFDENVTTFVQAPMKFPPIFHGNRLVVYGFVPQCTLATLRASINGIEVSTVVSTSDLSKTTGEVLHRLTARAIIRDWNQGFQDDIDSNDKLLKISKKLDIINLSRTYNVLSPMTSFVAIEQRTKDEVNETNTSDLVNSLLKEEEIDNLPYIDFDPAELSLRNNKFGTSKIENKKIEDMDFFDTIHEKSKKKSKRNRFVQDSEADMMDSLETDGPTLFSNLDLSTEHFNERSRSPLPIIKGRTIITSTTKPLISARSKAFMCRRSAPRSLPLHGEGGQQQQQVQGQLPQQVTQQKLSLSRFQPEALRGLSNPQFEGGPPSSPPQFGRGPPPPPPQFGGAPSPQFGGGPPPPPGVTQPPFGGGPPPLPLIVKHGDEMLPMTLAHVQIPAAFSHNSQNYSPTSATNYSSKFRNPSPSMSYSSSAPITPLAQLLRTDREVLAEDHAHENLEIDLLDFEEDDMGFSVDFENVSGEMFNSYSGIQSSFSKMSSSVQQRVVKNKELALSSSNNRSSNSLFGASPASCKKTFKTPIGPNVSNFSPPNFACQQSNSIAFGSPSTTPPGFSFGFKPPFTINGPLGQSDHLEKVSTYDVNFLSNTVFSTVTIPKAKRLKPPMIILSEIGNLLNEIDIVLAPTSIHLGSTPIFTTLKNYLNCCESSDSAMFNDSTICAMRKGWGTTDADFMKFQFLLLEQLTDQNLNLSKELDFWKDQQNDGAFDTSLNKELFTEFLEVSGIKSLGLALKTKTIRMCCTHENIIKTFIKLGALLPTTEIDDNTLDLEINKCAEQFLSVLAKAEKALIIKILMAMAFVLKFTEKYPVLFKNLQLKNYCTSESMFDFSHANWETFILSAVKHI